MNNYKLIRKSDLQIVCSYVSSNVKLFSGSWGNLGAYFTLQVPANLDPTCVKAIQSEGTYILVEDTVLLNNKALEQQAKLLDKIREERNSLLAACDWTQLLDVPLTDRQKQLYKLYRQELRDITKNCDINDIIWPIKPE